MPAITNFNPIHSINSLLQPLGLTLSNKQQVINKIALATLAVLAFSYGPQMVDACDTLACVQSRCPSSIQNTQASIDAYNRCIDRCVARCGPFVNG